MPLPTSTTSTSPSPLKRMSSHQLQRSLTCVDGGKLAMERNQAETDTTYTLVLHDAVDMPLACISFYRYQEKNYVLDAKELSADIKVVEEKVSDLVKRFVLKKILGVSYDKCEKRYLVVKKGRVLGKVDIDQLTHTYKMAAKSPFRWSVKSMHATDKTIAIPHNPSYSDILDSLCIEHERPTCKRMTPFFVLARTSV